MSRNNRNRRHPPRHHTRINSHKSKHPTLRKVRNRHTRMRRRSRHTSHMCNSTPTRHRTKNTIRRIRRNRRARRSRKPRRQRHSNRRHRRIILRPPPTVINRPRQSRVVSSRRRPSRISSNFARHSVHTKRGFPQVRRRGRRKRRRRQPIHPLLPHLRSRVPVTITHPLHRYKT